VRGGRRRSRALDGVGALSHGCGGALGHGGTLCDLEGGGGPGSVSGFLRGPVEAASEMLVVSAHCIRMREDV
jgi:phage tail tape-measure protein